MELKSIVVVLFCTFTLVLTDSIYKRKHQTSASDKESYFNPFFKYLERNLQDAEDKTPKLDSSKLKVPVKKKYIVVQAKKNYNAKKPTYKDYEYEEEIKLPIGPEVKVLDVNRQGIITEPRDNVMGSHSAVIGKFINNPRMINEEEYVDSDTGSSDSMFNFIRNRDIASAATNIFANIQPPPSYPENDGRVSNKFVRQAPQGSYGPPPSRQQPSGNRRPQQQPSSNYGSPPSRPQTRRTTKRPTTTRRPIQRRPPATTASYASRPQQQRPQNQQPMQGSGMPYSFEWRVFDEASRNDYLHRESSDGDVTQGQYEVLLPDGRRQIVVFRVDPESGYQAEVTYEGEIDPTLNQPRPSNQQMNNNNNNNNNQPSGGGYGG